MKTIKIDISPSGETKMAVVGGCGSECASLIAPIEKALGKTTDSERTADWNLRPVENTQSQTVAR